MRMIGRIAIVVGGLVAFAVLTWMPLIVGGIEQFADGAGADPVKGGPIGWGILKIIGFIVGLKVVYWLSSALALFIFPFRLDKGLDMAEKMSDRMLGESRLHNRRGGRTDKWSDLL